MRQADKREPPTLGALDDDQVGLGYWRRTDGVVVVFSGLQHRVLATLWRARQAVLTMKEIVNDLYPGEDGGPDAPEGAIHQAISTVRNKLAGCEHRIETVRDRGYVLLHAPKGVIGACKLRAREIPTETTPRQTWSLNDAAREARLERRRRERMKGSKE